MSDVTVIKMMNGEEIITKVVKEDESTFTCEKACYYYAVT